MAERSNSASNHRGLGSEERRRVMQAVALRAEDGWIQRFSVMLGLSVVVAVMGLSLDSAAVVIGAMLLAPLMTPVLGVSAAMAMAMPKALARSTTVVVVASVGSIGLSYLLARFMPAAQLTPETLSRTSPDLRDLIVALAAGAAGAYATVRNDVSSSLPGVAVAVALVPPLGAVGLTLAAGRGDLAQGAGLLYAANLGGIILIGAIVFVLTGFVPVRRLQQKRARLGASVALVTAIVVVIAVPLTLASVRAAEAGRRRAGVQTAVDNWIGGSNNDVDQVRIDGATVQIDISGPAQPPDTDDLDRALSQAIGQEADTRIRWTQTREPTNGRSEPADKGVVSASEVGPVVAKWLADRDVSGAEIDRLAVKDDEIQIDLMSASPPPPVETLSRLLDAELGVNLPVVINWTRRMTVRSGSETIDDVRDQIERVAAGWQDQNPTVDVERVRFDGENAIIDLLGPAPVPIAELEAGVQKVVGSDVTVQVWFTQRTLLDAALPPA